MANHAANGVREKQVKCKDSIIDIPFVLEPANWPECCIYGVPKKLRKVNKEAYTPKLISIGPLHHGSKELRDMEMQKVRYLRECCSRTGMSQSDLVDIIRLNEVKIRHCYAEASKLGSKKFVEMILLDGMFIIELLLRTYNGKLRASDYILSNPGLRTGIQHDLLLLENQLPFFVLEDLYKSLSDSCSNCNRHRECLLIMEDKEDFPSFLKLSRHYFSDYDQQRDAVIDKKVKHFTDLLRYFFCPPDLELKESKKGIDHLYSATKLDEAGVKFDVWENKPLLKLEFQKDKCLERCPYLNCSWLLNCLPCLRSLICLQSMQPFLKLAAFEIGHETECVFRNVMALEQCHYPTQAYVCNYILLLDCLINTENDVDLLVEKKVIVNKIGSHAAVARLVNRLGHQIVADDSCYWDLSEKLNKHYDELWNRNMATLTTVYFRDIWRGTATIVGIIFLLLTFWNIFLRHFVRMPSSFSHFGTN